MPERLRILNNRLKYSFLLFTLLLGAMANIWYVACKRTYNIVFHFKTSRSGTPTPLRFKQVPPLPVHLSGEAWTPAGPRSVVITAADTATVSEKEALCTNSKRIGIIGQIRTLGHVLCVQDLIHHALFSRCQGSHN